MRSMRLLVPLLMVLVTAFLAGPPSTMGAVSDPPFGPAHRIDDPATVVGGYNAAVDVDAAGNAVAVWQSAGTIYGARRPVDGSWSAPVALRLTHISEPDVVGLRNDGSAYFDWGTSAPDGDAIAIWYPDDSVRLTDLAGQYADGKVEIDVDDDVVAYVETANGDTEYHFARPGTDPATAGWTSTTTLGAFGSSQVTFGARHTYYVAYPTSSSDPGHLFRVALVRGGSGKPTIVVRHRLCPRADHSRVAGYDIGAGPSGAAVLAWRCTSRTADVIDAQRIRPGGGAGAIIEVARSGKAGVKDRLSGPTVTFGPHGPTVLFSRAITPARRSLLALTTDPTGRWRRPHAVVRSVEARSAKALGVRVDWAPTGAALISYRSGGFHGVIWAVRRVPGGAFGVPARVYPSALIRPVAVVADGTALLARVTRLKGKFIARLAPGVP
jgi:hypothetical protein